MLPVLILLCAYVNVAQAVLADPYVKPTARFINNEYLLDGWTPKPTQAPRVRTPFGAIANKDLFPRAIVSTCGYLNGDPSDPYTCDSGEECAFIYGVDPQYWQCCPLASGSAVNWASCTNYVDCVNYRTSSEPNTGSSTYTTGQTIYCPSANPICFTASLIQADAGSTYLSYGCWTETYTAFLYQNPTTQSSQPTSQTGSQQAPTSQSSVSDPSSTTQTSNPGPTSVSSTSSESPTELPISSTTTTMQFSVPQGGPSSHTQSNPNSGTSTPGPTHSSKKTNVGAIAGGVVGGVVVLGAIGIGIGYMMYRKRQQRVEPMREISPGYYAPSPSMNY